MRLITIIIIYWGGKMNKTNSGPHYVVGQTGTYTTNYNKRQSQTDVL